MKDIFRSKMTIWCCELMLRALMAGDLMIMNTVKWFRAVIKYMCIIPDEITP